MILLAKQLKDQKRRKTYYLSDKVIEKAQLIKAQSGHKSINDVFERLVELGLRQLKKELKK